MPPSEILLYITYMHTFSISGCYNSLLQQLYPLGVSISRLELPFDEVPFGEVSNMISYYIIMLEFMFYAIEKFYVEKLKFCKLYV